MDNISIILNQEEVYNGFRITKYLTNDNKVVEIKYNNPASSEGWNSIESITESEEDFSELPIYRSWNISNHPTIQNVYRRVDLVKMEITATEIKLLLAVKHFTDEERTLTAPFEAKIKQLVGNNEDLIYVSEQLQQMGYPAQMSEREYWDLLTNIGMTPYQLLDARIPEIDQQLNFDNIYGT